MTRIHVYISKKPQIGVKYDNKVIYKEQQNDLFLVIHTLADYAFQSHFLRVCVFVKNDFTTNP